MLKEIKTNKNIISPSSKTYIIAEIGINHNGKYDLAEKLIVESAKVDLNVKIGGCEAKNDIFFCKKN